MDRPYRVAAAACAADRLLSFSSSPEKVAYRLADLRAADFEHIPWQLDVMEWAHVPVLRPNPYLDALVRRQVITIGDVSAVPFPWARWQAAPYQHQYAIKCSDAFVTTLRSARG